MIAGFLYACSIWSIRLGSYFSFILDKRKRDDIDGMLTSAYVAADDFSGKGLVRRSASWYVELLEGAKNHEPNLIAGGIRTFLLGCVVGLIWSLIIWIGLHGTFASLPSFFFAGTLNAILLISAIEVALVFTVDVWLVSLIAKAVNQDRQIVGKPAIALIFSLFLAAFSWSTLSGLFSASAFLGPLIRSGDISNFYFTPSWLLNRWWTSLVNPISGGLEIKLQATNRFVTNSAFGVPAAIASSFFLLMILTTWITEISGPRVSKKAAKLLGLAHGRWVWFTKTVPSYDVKKISFGAAAIFLVLAFWAAASGL